jgi:hypothetical protein
MSNGTRGGKRQGAGRPRTPAHLLKIPISVKLPRWLIEWMATQPESRAILIERALCETHKIGKEIDGK